MTYINRRCECFLVDDEGLPVVGKAPEIAMPKYRAIPWSNCFAFPRQAQSAAGMNNLEEDVRSFLGSAHEAIQLLLSSGKPRDDEISPSS
jgi:hypothetical protein